jgi:hypothetical protein
MALAGGWNFEDLVEALNERVFFWPGTEHGPIDYGLRHFARYESECPLTIRVRTDDLFEANPRSIPEFCDRNSGSPRYSGGRASPRGPDTFVMASRFTGAPSRVVELTFTGSVRLPEVWQVGTRPDGPWLSRVAWQRTP